MTSRFVASLASIVLLAACASPEPEPGPYAPEVVSELASVLRESPNGPPLFVESRLEPNGDMPGCDLDGPNACTTDQTRFLTTLADALGVPLRAADGPAPVCRWTRDGEAEVRGNRVVVSAAVPRGDAWDVQARWSCDDSMFSFVQSWTFHVEVNDEGAIVLGSEVEGGS